MAFSLTDISTDILNLLISQWQALSSDLPAQRAQARDLRNLGQTCKKLFEVMQVHLPILKAIYSQNVKIKCSELVVMLYPPLHSAVMATNETLVKALLAVEDVNLLDKYGRSALHIATGMDKGKGRLRLVQLLLTHPGIDITLQYKGKTAKQLSKNPEIQDLLQNF